MKISVIRTEHFQINEVPSEVIFEKESDHVPNQGDILKIGNNLNGFETVVVEKRVFRSLPGRAHETEAFQQVILLVADTEAMAP